jgi:soluble lytic murein transglycosylase-like protein
MADTDTQIPNTADAIADLQRQLRQPAPTIPTGTPDDGTSPSWTGLLGRVLGGAPAGYQLRGGEADAAGNRALLNFGINMLLASGPHAVRPNVLSSLATGLQGAQESVGQDQRSAAALAAAQYQAAREARQDQLARIKEAIPLLQLQANQRAVAGVPYTVGGGGKPGTPPPGTSIATGGSIAVPPELLPIYQEASARTGIPVDVLIAQGKQESGFNPNAVGGAGEIGLHQIKPSTAKDPGFGMTGIDPATLKDPRVNINFAADYLKARGGPRTDFSDPATVNAALKNYNGGGDPNYVANVNRYRPGALTAVTGAAAPPAAAPGVPVPPAALGGDSRAPIQMPPPVQVAGPGAGSAPSAPPPGPTTQAAAPPDVPWLPGQVGPATGPLAPPGQGTIPAASPDPAMAPPAPGSGPPVFRYTPSQIPPGLIPPGTFTPEQQQAVKTIQDAYVHERQAALTPADVQRAESNFGTNMTKVLGSQTDAAKVATDALLKFHEADFRQQQDTHAKMLDDYLKQQQADQAQRYKLAEITATGEQSRLSNDKATINSRNEKTLTALDTEANAARGSISELDGLKALSDNVKQPNVWATVPWGDTTVLNRMAQAGLADKGEAGATQMLQTGISSVIKSLRQGMAMGSLSDRDLNFIQGMGPNLYQDQTTRSAVIGYLKQAQQAKIRFNVEVNKEMSRPGTNMADAIDRAQQTMETKYPIVPKIAQDLWDHRNDPDPGWAQRRREWAADNNIGVGTLYRSPGGGLQLVK